MDSIGLYWIGKDSMKRFQWSSSDNIFTLPDVHLTSATLLRRNFWKYHFHWKVLGIEFWLFYWKTTFSFRIYRYVCQLILNVHVGSEMHIVLHQKWGHACRPHNVSLWIGFKIIQITKLSQPVFARDQFTKAQKRKSGAFRSAAVIMNELQRSIEGWEVITWSVAIKSTKILYLPTWLYPGIQASAWLKMLSVQT